MNKCEPCQKEFETADALEMHNKAKHAELQKEPWLTAAQKKKLRNWTIIFVILGFIIFGTTWLVRSPGGNGGNEGSVDDEVPLTFDVPQQPIHWHPHLTIRIDGKERSIPANIGLSGAHQPIHTHEEDGILHMENNRPTSETVILGFFFKVWGKTFTKDCIFDYCTDQGTLKMTVNGQENFEYGSYFMKDGDQIVIEYVSRGKNESTT